MIVMKFGGTSVESATAIARVATIVQARVDRRPVVVVSAMGKTTNRLLAMARAAAEGQRARSAPNAVSSRHVRYAPFVRPRTAHARRIASRPATRYRRSE
ncbi:MAG: hypothetical protein JNL62_25140, partial [Bryobacterales bacterium]|nr:hypothetical protein [Bryobacterales bacterium]